MDRLSLTRISNGVKWIGKFKTVLCIVWVGKAYLTEDG